MSTCGVRMFQSLPRGSGQSVEQKQVRFRLKRFNLLNSRGYIEVDGIAGLWPVAPRCAGEEQNCSHNYAVLRKFRFCLHSFDELSCPPRVELTPKSWT